MLRPHQSAPAATSPPRASPASSQADPPPTPPPASGKTRAIKGSLLIISRRCRRYIYPPTSKTSASSAPSCDLRCAAATPILHPPAPPPRPEIRSCPDSSSPAIHKPARPPPPP